MGEYVVYIGIYFLFKVLGDFCIYFVSVCLGIIKYWFCDIIDIFGD